MYIPPSANIRLAGFSVSGERGAEQLWHRWRIHRVASQPTLAATAGGPLCAGCSSPLAHLVGVLDGAIPGRLTRPSPLCVCAGTFLRGVLDKVGVEPQVQRIGEFKSAGDQLLRRTMSTPQRQQLSELCACRWQEQHACSADAGTWGGFTSRSPALLPGAHAAARQSARTPPLPPSPPLLTPGHAGEIVEDVYDNFLTSVAAARGKTKEVGHPLAQTAPTAACAAQAGPTQNPEHHPLRQLPTRMPSPARCMCAGCGGAAGRGRVRHGSPG